MEKRKQNRNNASARVLWKSLFVVIDNWRWPTPPVAAVEIQNNGFDYPHPGNFAQNSTAAKKTWKSKVSYFLNKSTKRDYYLRSRLHFILISFLDVYYAIIFAIN